MTKNIDLIFKDKQHLFEESIAVTKKHSSSFYFAFKPLTIAKRNSIYALYHFLRLLDDSVDNENFEQFNNLKECWHQFKNNQLSTTNAPWPALNLVFSHFNIETKWIDDMICGQEQDSKKLPIITFEDLDYYCYQVAGTVGLMLMPILNDNQDFDYEAAINVGKAMQLTNILRDIKEDVLDNKIYLSQEELTSYQVTTQDLVKNKATPNLTRLIKAKVDLALDYYQDVEKLLPSISDSKSRLALKLAVAVYQGILTEIIKNNYQVLNKRLYVSHHKKLALLAKLSQ